MTKTELQDLAKKIDELAQTVGLSLDTMKEVKQKIDINYQFAPD